MLDFNKMCPRGIVQRVLLPGFQTPSCEEREFFVVRDKAQNFIYKQTWTLYFLCNNFYCSQVLIVKVVLIDLLGWHLDGERRRGAKTTLTNGGAPKWSTASFPMYTRDGESRAHRTQTVCACVWRSGAPSWREILLTELTFFHSFWNWLPFRGPYFFFF